MAGIVKYLKSDAITTVAGDALKNRQAINRLITTLNTGGINSSVAEDAIPELMGETAATITSTFELPDTANPGSTKPIQSKHFAIDDKGVTHLFIYDAALQSTDEDKKKQWHQINMGISQEQADARYLQIGVQEFAPKIKVGAGPFVNLIAIGDPIISTIKNTSELIIDFEDVNITKATGITTIEGGSTIYVAEDINAVNENTPYDGPTQTGMIPQTLPKLLKADGNPYPWSLVELSKKANTFRFKKTLKAGVTESAATWNDWVYTFVKLEPKIVPVKTLTKQYANWAELEADKDEIVALLLRPKAQIDWYGAAIRKDAIMPFMPTFSVNNGFTGASNMSNGTEYKTTAVAAGVILYNQGAQIGSGSAGTITWDKFDIYGTVLVGNALTSAGGSGMLMGNLGDVYDLENGRGVAHSVDKVLNIENVAELVKDQRDIDKQFLAQFTDHIYFTDLNNAVPQVGHFQYVDAEILDHTVNNIRIPMGNYEVRRNGNAVTYTGAGIDPFARIEQEQADFKVTVEKPSTTITYHFTTTGKQIRFKCANANDWYKWEMFGKFENGTRLMYVRFSASSGTTIETSSDGNTWASHNQLYEAHPTDFQANTAAGKLAEVTFDFGTSFPSHGPKVKVATVDYLTATIFVQNRLSTIIEQVEEKMTALDGKIDTKPDIENTDKPTGVLDPLEGKLVLAKAALAAPHKVHYYTVENNLASVKVDTSHAGQLLRVKADGSLEYVTTHDVAITFDDNSTDTWKVVK